MYNWKLLKHQNAPITIKEFLVFQLAFFFFFFIIKTQDTKKPKIILEFIFKKATEKYSNKGLLEAQTKVYLVL
jgi:hypothetical protein